MYANGCAAFLLLIDVHASFTLAMMAISSCKADHNVHI